MNKPEQVNRKTWQQHLKWMEIVNEERKRNQTRHAKKQDKK